MKIFEIWDEETDKTVGTLLFYEKEKTFIIELTEDLDEWSAPLLFTGFVNKKKYTIPRDISRLFIEERVIPPSRQNIASILTQHGLKEYDEMKFLELSEGRCSQDGLYIKKADRLPDYVRRRQEKNIRECCILYPHILLCVFTDGSIRKVDLSELNGVKDVEKIIRNDTLFTSAKVGTGGYYITFHDSIDIPADALYRAGKKIGISADELLLFLKQDLMDTAETCEMLQCSRQNLAYLVRQGLLTPVKETAKGTLYLKGDVIKCMW